MERFRTTLRTSYSVKVGGDLQRDRCRSWWKIRRKPYAVRTVKFFRTGDDPIVKFSYDKLGPQDPLRECCVVCVRGVLEDYSERSIKEFNKKSRCQKCMLSCCCCFCVHLFLCCCMFNECMVTCYLALVRCLGSLWGWCTDRFRGR